MVAPYTPPPEPSNGRNILAGLAGLFVGGCLNMGIIQLNSTVFFPMPEGIDMNVPDSSTAILRRSPQRRSSS